jgi:hypothetical protein
VQVRPGEVIRIRATGRYEVAQQPKPWLCEPQGVTLRYIDGRPLGMLLAAVHPHTAESGKPSALLEPIVIGRGATIRPEAAGTLYWRINDAPSELADNRGELSVEIRRGD